ncbi:hypothetical protein GWO43_14225, partial [candidate division KSB1 bacterium]|nr:hypothetical protein [candidate division KSB1 bacterium]NIV70492.1 hypothetical protein [Phycisphaerae bacterium]NIS25081.1 hypothetical protein [candidate division KSB1 bacterium]NIT72000.1 hypothetical protein [candidate division KSB1 bacterium]NIU25123.1 hypothetical protein [candidate division KSB1 bacterium]
YQAEAKNDTAAEKIKSLAKKAVDKYTKLPMRYKLAAAAGLFGAGVAGGAMGGAAGAVLLTG